MKPETILAQALADMKSRQGVTLADLEPGEIVLLVRACEKVANPFDEVNADAAGFPVRVTDGIWFWRLTVGASIWMDHVDRLLGGEKYDPRYRLALIYACRYSRQPDRFAECATVRDLKRMVKAGLKDLSATPAEIDAALDTVLGVKPKGVSAPEETRRAAVSWAKLCARLETQTGVPSEEWIWNRSGAYLVKCYNDLHEFARAYGTVGGSPERMLDELDDAVNALQRLKVAIAKRLHNG